MLQGRDRASADTRVLCVFLEAPLDDGLLGQPVQDGENGGVGDLAWVVEVLVDVSHRHGRRGAPQHGHHVLLEVAEYRHGTTVTPRPKLYDAS